MKIELSRWNQGGNMIINKIIMHFKRKIVRFYEKNFYFKESYNKLREKIDKSKKHRIWFIGSAHYDNIGDLAISEATVKFISKNFPNYDIIEIRLCDYFKYVKAIKKLIKNEDVIVLQGGGNMGFAYFDAELNRRMVINSFRNNRIIVFPSTIDYGNSLRDKLEFKKSIKIYNKHKDLIICAREMKSYNLMKKIYNNVILVPDIVLSLGYIDYNLKKDKVIICLRKDNESTRQASELLNKLSEKENCYYTDNVAECKNISIELRKEIFNNKLKELSTAKIVITDRLHVMIFCTLIKTPCLFIDNSNKKISGVFNLWIKNKCNYIREIETESDIDMQIEKMMKIKPEYYSDFSSEFEDLLKCL